MSQEQNPSQFDEQSWFEQIVQELLLEPESDTIDNLHERYLQANKISLIRAIGHTVRLGLYRSYVDFRPIAAVPNGVFCGASTAQNERAVYVVRGTLLAQCKIDDFTEQQLDYGEFLIQSLRNEHEETPGEKDGTGFIAVRDTVCETGYLVVQPAIPVSLEVQALEKGIISQNETSPLRIWHDEIRYTDFLISNTVRCMTDPITLADVLA